MSRGCVPRPRSVAANAVFVAAGEVRAVFAMDGVIDPAERAALAALELAVFEGDRADIQDALGDANRRAGPRSDRVKRLERQWEALMASRETEPAPPATAALRAA